MSIQSMVSAAGIPMDSPGSLFKNPAAEGLAKYTAAKDSFSVFGDAMVLGDPLFDPSVLIDSMTTQSTGINEELATQVKNLSSNLSIMTVAADTNNSIEKIDSMLSDNPSAPFPDVVSEAFPADGCPKPSISSAFQTITSSNSLVTGTFTEMGNSLNMTQLAPVTQAIKAAGGPTITTGQQLLEYLGSASTAVKSAVSAVIAGSSSIINSLKTSFSSSLSSVSSLNTDFTATVESDASAISGSLKQIQGFSTVQMLTRTDPCTTEIMGKVVNTNNVDVKALTVYTDSSNVLLPGQESVEVVQSGSTLPEISPTVDTPAAAEVVKASPIKVPYSDSQYTTVMVPILQAQSALVTQMQKANAEWLKANVEDWKVANNYQAKKIAAGATEANPYGTSSDPAILAEWKAVYDVYATKRDYFNNTLLPPEKAERKKFDDMTFEKKQRLLYGKYPYTYSNSIGIVVPPDMQFTYLDTTK